ncbi:MAG TPA: hypothetical protein VFA15_05775, partial [Nitrososphaera sp.]|nr:hypothetical protein [Nitrososphaera sp.]
MAYNRDMFSIFRPRTELGIVFHIGTASVGAGLVRFDQGKLPNVIYSFREHLPFRDHVTPDRFLADMVKALGNVNDRIARDGLSHLKFTEFGSLALGKKVSRVMYVFSSPWAVTQTKVISIKEDNPFTLTKE